MERNAMLELVEWKQSARRKPLIIKGARQVGKTWLIKEFGKRYYEKYFYFNFDEEEQLHSVFQSNKDPHRIIQLLGLISEHKIEPEKHLIIFDEVQECPEALNALKYFYENANEYHVISAGSLLGTLLAQPKSYPVGKVNILYLNPLTFEEFLQAVKPALYEYYCEIHRDSKIEDIFHERLMEMYRLYLIIGGMPECVLNWIETEDAAVVNKIQGELIALYENDFSKHNGKVNSGRILMVFRSIVTQLAKNNKKFVYGCIREGARAREFEEAIEWLVSAGMILRTYNVSKAQYPIKTYEELNHFKLYLFDVGILKHMAGISNQSIILKKDYQFSGALAENYVIQQLQGVYEIEPHYYAPTSNEEIDLVIQDGMNIIPGEIKAGESIRSNAFHRYMKKISVKRRFGIVDLAIRRMRCYIIFLCILLGRRRNYWKKVKSVKEGYGEIL